MEEKEELHIVTEQGMFGELDMADPSKVKVLSEEELKEEIEKAKERNLNNLK